MSFSTLSSESTHDDEGQMRGRMLFDSRAHYIYGASPCQHNQSHVTKSRCESASLVIHGNVYRLVPHIPQQEFKGPMPIVVENSGLVNEMIMKLLQDFRATSDIGATSHLMTISA